MLFVLTEYDVHRVQTPGVTNVGSYKNNGDTAAPY